MKRPVAVLCLCAFAGFFAAAQDAWLDLETSATVSRESAQDFTIYEKLSPGFVLPFGTAAEIAGSGFVKFAWSSAGTTDVVSYGLRQLRYALVLKDPREGMKSFEFNVGRFAMSDPGAYILSSPVDGVSLAFNYPAVRLSFRSAYTGLLFLSDSEILMSRADRARDAAGTELTGSPRFLVQADLELPSVYGQSVLFSVLSQSDLNPAGSFADEGSIVYSATKGGRLNTQYFELKAGGSVSVVSYGAFFVYGTGSTLSWIASGTTGSGTYQYRPISSFLTGLNLSAPLPLPQPFTGSSLGARFLVASGDKDASSFAEGNTTDVYKAFTPMNATTLAAVFSPDLSNIIFCEANLSTVLPVSRLRLAGSAKVMTFFRPTAGPISEPGVDAASTSPFLGTEFDLAVSCGITSDVALSFIGGVFVPGDAFAAANRAVQYSAGISVRISM